MSVDINVAGGGALVVGGSVVAGAGGLRAYNAVQSAFPFKSAETGLDLVDKLVAAQPAVNASMDNITEVSASLKKGSKPWDLPGVISKIDGPVHAAAVDALRPAMDAAEPLKLTLHADADVFNALPNKLIRPGSVAVAGGAVALLGASMLIQAGVDRIQGD